MKFTLSEHYLISISKSNKALNIIDKNNTKCILISTENVKVLQKNYLNSLERPVQIKFYN